MPRRLLFSSLNREVSTGQGGGGVISQQASGIYTHSPLLDVYLSLFLVFHRLFIRFIFLIGVYVLTSFVTS